ncbi:MAG: carboxypeptidase-like regulatory domain-containing protein, partial [Myxococcales bacterium]|nr:carboxypeptidase-like regulatory domain-containing protein [Myxococcales bacterium]
PLAEMDTREREFPVMRATLELTDGARESRTCETDAEGRCAFASLAPGFYELTVQHEWDFVPVTIRDLHVQSGETTQFTVRLQRIEYDGVITRRGPSGTSLAGARAAARRSGDVDFFGVLPRTPRWPRPSPGM